MENGLIILSKEFINGQQWVDHRICQWSSILRRQYGHWACKTPISAPCFVLGWTSNSTNCTTQVKDSVLPFLLCYLSTVLYSF